MKYTVVRSCGHEQEIKLFGKVESRESKLEWYRSTPCTACYKAEQNSGCEEIEMHYSEYKNKYSHCDTKPDSYNNINKTIVVYVPIEKKEKQDNKKIVISVAEKMNANFCKALESVKGDKEKEIAINNIKIVIEKILNGELFDLFENCKDESEIITTISKIAEQQL